MELKKDVEYWGIKNYFPEFDAKKSSPKQNHDF